MATKSDDLYERIEPDVKEQAESILSALSIPVSNAINMFYKQMILQNLRKDMRICLQRELNLLKKVFTDCIGIYKKYAMYYDCIKCNTNMKSVAMHGEITAMPVYSSFIFI